MSIETQATFLYRNVCDYDPNINNDIDIPEQIKAGFDEFSTLLRAIYQDWRSFETSTLPSEKTKIGINADDLENFHNLSYTIICLSAISRTGELRSEGATQYIHVNKDVMKKTYKYTIPIKFIFSMLEKHGFYFTFSKKEKEVDEYTRCDNFNVYYENGDELLGAIKYITNRLDEPERQREFSKEAADIHSRMPGGITFLVADYDVILNNKTTCNPIDVTILRTLGKRNELWKELINLLHNEYGLGSESVEISCSPYVFPEKTVYYKQKKKIICKFEIMADQLKIWLPNSYEAAINFIMKKENLSPNTINYVKSFGCSIDCCGHCDKNDLKRIIAAIGLKD